MNIKTTTNYDWFKNVTGNRAVSNAHVRLLQESIKKYPQLVDVMPVICNKKGEVHDGQHRIEAFKGLDMPVRYVEVEGLDIEDIQAINSTSKKWSTMDFVKSYAITNDNNYKKLLTAHADLKKTFGASINTAATLHCSPKQFHTVGMLIKEGIYKYHHNSDLVNKWTDFMVTAPTRQSYFKTRVFIKTLEIVRNHKKYNHKKMLTNLGKVGETKLEKTAPQTTKEVIVALEDVYNHKAKTRTTFN